MGALAINATLIGEVIAFAIMIALTMKFVWPPLMKAIEERQRRIEEGLEAVGVRREPLVGLAHVGEVLLGRHDR